MRAESPKYLSPQGSSQWNTTGVLLDEAIGTAGLPIDFEAIVGPEAWARYWEDCESVVTALRQSQELANTLKAEILAAARGRPTPGPGGTPA